jgi:hypothetical protein
LWRRARRGGHLKPQIQTIIVIFEPNHPRQMSPGFGQGRSGDG